MRVSIVQLDTVWEKKEANFERVRQLLGTAPVDSICLPEMFATGFSMDIPRIAEGPEGVTFQFLQALARERQSAVLGTVVQQGRQGGRNTALLFDRSGTLLSTYAKIHPFSFAGEDKRYEKGEHLPIVELGGFQVATPICYDLRFPELFRHATHRGATLYIVPANWPTKRVHHWRQLLIARAIENLCYVIGINRAGVGNELDYPGSSMIIAPTGEVLADGEPGERIVSGDITPEAVATHRTHFHFLDDVRSDLFPDLFGAGSPSSVGSTARSVR